MSSFSGANIQLLRDILMREQTYSPDTCRVVKRMLPQLISLNDVIGRALTIWDVHRSDLLSLNAMLCVLTGDFFTGSMEAEGYAGICWKVDGFGYAEDLSLRKLPLTARLCCVGMASKPNEILRFLGDLDKSTWFAQHELLPLVRRFEPWHSLLTRSARSLSVTRKSI